MKVDEHLRAIESIDPGSVTRQADLRQISRWKIGGTALAVFEPSSVETLRQALPILERSDLPLAVVGDTSNVLFDSAGFGGVLIRIGPALSKIHVDAPRLWVGAGAGARDLAEMAMRHSLSGVEHIVGIPGTVGGLIAMNGGSMRKGIGDSVVEVHAVTKTGQSVVLSRAESEFSYRSSIFQELDVIIVGAWLELHHAESATIAETHVRILESRQGRFPQDLPNCGSTFASDPAAYVQHGSPGEMIEAAGLKGFRVGDSQFSDHHANFVVNLGDATSSEVLSLISEARMRVKKATTHEMRSEVRYISRDGSNVAAHIAADK